MSVVRDFVMVCLILIGSGLVVGCQGRGGRVATDGPTVVDLRQGWTLVEPGGETRCAHNTPFAYWVKRGAVNKLLVYFQGGGGCWSAETCAPGSRYYDDAVTIQDDPELLDGLFNLDHPDNPFSQYHAVYIPSCTGDLHVGNNVQTYFRPDGAALTVHHRGFVNASTALEWAYANVPDPESVFVSGCSAGSVGSIFHAPYLIERYPEAAVTQLGDSLAFVFHQPVDLISDYRAHENFAGWIPALRAIRPGELVMSDVYGAIANYYPGYTFSQFNTVQDQVQAFFYTALGGNAANFAADLAGSLSAIHAQAPNFRSFTAAGDLHCLTPRPAFYTQATEGVTFRDWIADLADGRVVEDVVCPGCRVQMGPAGN